MKTYTNIHLFLSHLFLCLNRHPHFVPACWSDLQCIEVCCSVLKCVAMCWDMWQCIEVCCSVLRCAAACWGVLQWLDHNPSLIYLLWRFNLSSLIISLALFNTLSFSLSLFLFLSLSLSLSLSFSFSLSLFLFLSFSLSLSLSLSLFSSLSLSLPRVYILVAHHLCGRMHSYTWHDLSICGMWPIHMRRMTYSYA